MNGGAASASSRTTHPSASRTRGTTSASTRPSAAARASTPEPVPPAPERELRPSGVEHHADGSVTIDGEPVDDPERYKGDPLPRGPTDPNALGPDPKRARE
jgi:hypothetical protein